MRYGNFHILHSLPSKINILDRSLDINLSPMSQSNRTRSEAVSHSGRTCALGSLQSQAHGWYMLNSVTSWSDHLGYDRNWQGNRVSPVEASLCGILLLIGIGSMQGRTCKRLYMCGLPALTHGSVCDVQDRLGSIAAILGWGWPCSVKPCVTPLVRHR